MSDATFSDPDKAKSDEIIAAALIEQYGAGSLQFAIDQEAAAMDGNAEAWSSVVKRLRERSE